MPITTMITLTDTAATIAGYSILTFLLVGLSACFYMLYRNKKVYEWRKRELDLAFDTEELANAKDLDAYLRIAEEQTRRYLSLPDYNTMLLRFWVWPLDKFKKGAYAVPTQES